MTDGGESVRFSISALRRHDGQTAARRTPKAFSEGQKPSFSHNNIVPWVIFARTKNPPSHVGPTSEGSNEETMRISKHTLFHGTKTLERSFLGVANPHGDDLR